MCVYVCACVCDQDLSHCLQVCVCVYLCVCVCVCVCKCVCKRVLCLQAISRFLAGVPFTSPTRPPFAHTHIDFFCNPPLRARDCSTQSIIYVPLLVCVFHKSILLIVQYKYLKNCSKDFTLQNLILRTRSCGNGFIPQHC